MVPQETQQYNIRQRWKRYHRLINVIILKPECEATTSAAPFHNMRFLNL